MGGVRNLSIRAEGYAGHTGLALLQYNNGPGWIEHVTVEGFKTGIEINDGWGEIFALADIEVVNQNPGGTGISITDKQIAMENIRISQVHPDVTPIRLFDDDSYNSDHGGAPHLVLLNAEITSASPVGVPAIRIETGHSYLRNIRTGGYGNGIMVDHGKIREFSGGSIKGE